MTSNIGSSYIIYFYLVTLEIFTTPPVLLTQGLPTCDQVSSLQKRTDRAARDFSQISSIILVDILEQG